MITNLPQKLIAEATFQKVRESLKVTAQRPSSVRQRPDGTPSSAIQAVLNLSLNKKSPEESKAKPLNKAEILKRRVQEFIDTLIEIVNADQQLGEKNEAIDKIIKNIVSRKEKLGDLKKISILLRN